MRQSTSANSEGPMHARASAWLGGARCAESAVGEELGLITRDAAVGTGALTALLVVWNTTNSQLDLICACGTAAGDDRLADAAMQSRLLNRVRKSGRTIAEPTHTEDPLFARSPRMRVTYAVGASVRPPGGPRGALCVGLPSKPADADATMWIVESYARLAALCLHDEAALDGLLAAAREDPLTGCLNYGAIRAELQKETGRSARHRRVVSCCFLDLDHFKQINELHGHLHGSWILAEVAKLLRTGVRIGDTVGRYGGDEFVIVLPDTDREAACALAERLRAKICSTTAERDRGRLDASIGVAAWTPGMTADELLAAADHALRSAKQSGGGRVVLARDAAVGAGRGVAGASAVRDGNGQPPGMRVVGSEALS